jgi:translation initiation factor IF-2
LASRACRSAGDPLQVVENEARAREVAEYRQSRADAEAHHDRAGEPREHVLGADRPMKAKEYPLVVKADTQGHRRGDRRRRSTRSRPIEIKRARAAFGRRRHHRKRRERWRVPSGAPIIGFNVRANAKAREIADRQKVALKYYDVIYDLIDEIRAGMAGELGPEAFETVVGRAEIREVFSAGKHGKAAGLLVVEGVIRKALKARITRNDVIIYQGEIASLRRFKDDVAEVRAGLECGVTFSAELHRHQGRRLSSKRSKSRCANEPSNPDVPLPLGEGGSCRRQRKGEGGNGTGRHPHPPTA